MLKKNWWLAGGLLVMGLLVSGTLWAWSPGPSTFPVPVTVVLETVTSVEARGSSGSPGSGWLVIRGTATGTTAISEWFGSVGDVTTVVCHKNALLMMSRPGRFRLALGTEPRGPYASTCELSVR